MKILEENFPLPNSLPHFAFDLLPLVIYDIDDVAFSTTKKILLWA